MSEKCLHSCSVFSQFLFVFFPPPSPSPSSISQSTFWWFVLFYIVASRVILHSHIVGCVSRLAKVNEKLKWNEKTNPWKCQCRHVARVWFIYLLSLFAVSPSICNSFQINLFLCVGIADGNRNRRCVFCSIARNPLAAPSISSHLASLLYPSVLPPAYALRIMYTSTKSFYFSSTEPDTVFVVFVLEERNGIQLQQSWQKKRISSTAFDDSLRFA